MGHDDRRGVASEATAHPSLRSIHDRRDDTIDSIDTALRASGKVTEAQRRDALQLIRSRSRKYPDDPYMSDVSARFVVGHALEDAGIHRDERLDIVEAHVGTEPEKDTDNAGASSASKIFLIDTSGSMREHEEKIEVLLEPVQERDVVVTTSFRDEPPINVESDRSEGVDVPLDFHGSTPLADALEGILEVADLPIVIITDGYPNDADRYEQVKGTTDRQIREINLLEEVASDT